jgi:hypothetical protein
MDEMDEINEQGGVGAARRFDAAFCPLREIGV